MTAHAASQTRSPTACTTSGGAGNAWNNPGNAFSSNDVVTTTSVDGSTSEALECTDFGFAIPGGVTITGIEVNIERRSSSTNNGGTNDFSLFLLGGTLTGSNLADTVTDYPTTDAVATYGSATEPWGNSWSVAQINANAFGTAFRARKPSGGGAAHTISVDHIQITVHYTNPPPAPTLMSPTDGASVATATPTFDWTDVVDPDGDAVTYEMQADNTDCTFVSPEVDVTGLVASTHTPGALGEGTYCWRARAVDALGAASPWSATRNVTIDLPGSSQTANPGACATGGGAGNAWNNPANAFTSNNSDATVFTDGNTSEQLRCTNYGFSLPVDAVILGIEVNVERSSNSTNNGGSRDAQLLLLGGTLTGSDLADTVTNYGTTDEIVAHGGPSETWGNTWTPAQINANAFGAALRVTKPAGAGPGHTVSVDHMPITVRYTRPPPVPTLVSPADGAIVMTTTPTFDWTDVVDPDGDVVTYEIQADNTDCTFVSPEVNVTGLAASTYTPGALAGGTYCWRVLARDSFGAASPWSVMRNVSIVPSGFQAVETGAAAGTTILTRQAGVSFSLDILSLDGGGSVLTGYTGSVNVSLVNANSGGGVCASMTVLQDLGSMALSNTGRTTINTFNSAAAARNARIRVIDATAGVTTCSLDNFAIRPGAFTVTSTNATNAGTGAGATIKTGANFNLTATALAGYDGTPVINNAQVIGTPTAGTIGGGFAAAPIGTGIAAGNSFYYDEVGNVGLGVDAVTDTTFTAVDQPNDCIGGSTSNTPVSGRIGCTIGSAAVPQVTGSSGFGRFIPDNFSAAFVAPSLAAACGNFSYVGQTFTYSVAPVLTVTARKGTSNGLANGTALNYAGSYAKFSNTSLAQGSYATQPGRYARVDTLGGGATPALDVTGLPATTGDPVIGTFANGVGSFTFGAGSGLSFTRSTTTPNAPFGADIALALEVIDADLVTGGVVSTGTMAFTGGNAMRYGQLRLGADSGSQILLLELPVEAQYWNGTFWITNVDDNCTSLVSANVGLGNHQLPLNPGETAVIAVTSPLSAGRGAITLSAPGAGNNGSVDVAVNLGAVPPGTGTADACPAFAPAATAANLAYMRGKWCGAAATRDPSARARFGIRGGSSETIYRRESFN